MARRFIAASTLIGAAVAQVAELGAICTSETAYVNPILIEIAVATPTVIDVFGEVTLTVTDVPTSISTLTYGTRTETDTYIYTYTTTFGSITSGAPTAIPTAGTFDTAFALAFAPGGAKAKRDVEIGAMHKRDTLPGVDLLTSGGFTDNCAEAVSYFLRNGTVYADGEIISTSGGIGFQAFISTIPPLNVTEFFSLTDAVLSWVNSEFADLEAAFCATDAGEVYAVFDGTQTPEGCTTGALLGVPGANCPGFNPVYPADVSSTASASSTATASSNSTATMPASSSATASSSASVNSTATASSSTAASSGSSSSSSSAASSSAASSSAASSSSTASTTGASSSSSGSTTASATSSVASSIVSDLAAAADDAADEEAIKRVMRRRRNKLSPNAKVVRGGFADLDELEADEDA